MGLLGAKSIVNKLGSVAAPTVLAAVGILDGSPSSPAHLEPTWSTWAPPNVLVGDRASGRGGDTFTSRRRSQGCTSGPPCLTGCCSLYCPRPGADSEEGGSSTEGPKTQWKEPSGFLGGPEVKNLPANKTQVLWKPRFDSWLEKIPWRRKWSPVFLPGEFHGQRSLLGYSPRGHKKSEMTE